MRHLPLSPIRTGGKQTRTSDHRLEVDGLSFDVHRSDRCKTLQITVERTGALSIVAPLQAADQQLVQFVEEKLLWVHTKIEEKERLQQRAPIKEFVDGEWFLYFGKSYRLRLVESQLVDLSLRNGRFLPTGDGERVCWQKTGFRSKGCRPRFFSETFEYPSPACFSSTAGGVTAT